LWGFLFLLSIDIGSLSAYNYCIRGYSLNSRFSKEYQMARDYLSLGSTPAGENCQQLGPNYNPVKARMELTAYIDQLKRQFPDYEEKGIYFRSKSFPHDFGTYTEVVVWFDDLSDTSCSAAFDVENNTPEFWDEEAKKFLQHHGCL
jgi:hypothetical protein